MYQRFVRANGLTTRMLARYMAQAIWVLLCAVVVGLHSITPSNAQNTSVSAGVGDTVLQVNGQTSPNAFVTLLDDGTIIGTVTASASGDYSQTFPAFEPGIHQISVYATDTQSRTTDPAHVEVNVAEHFTTTVEVFIPPVIVLDASNVEQGTPIIITGSSIPDAEIILTLDNSQNFTIIADSAGEWSFSLATNALAAGSHSIYAVAKNTTTSTQSSATAERTFTVFTESAPEVTLPPLTTTPTAPVQRPQPPTITSPQNGASFNNSLLTVRGRAAPLTRIDLYNKDQIIGSAFANQQGDWRIDITLTESTYNLGARACIRTLCSDFSTRITIYFQAQPGTTKQGLSIKLEPLSTVAEVGTVVNYSLGIKGGMPPYQLRIDWGDGRTETLTTAQTNLTINHKYTKTGRFNGKVTVLDTNGGQAQVTFAAEIVATATDLTPILLLILLILIGVIVLVLVMYMVHRRWRKKSRSKQA